MLKRIAMMMIACFLTSIGVLILNHSQIVTGGTAGLALSLSYLFHFPFSITFFFINLPFYVFALLRMGVRFTVSTVFSVSVLSLLTTMNQWLPDFTIPSFAGAIIGGAIIGMGLSLLFMNGASLGGANILALFLQQRFHMNPGKINFLFDLFVVLLSIYTVGLIKGIFSIISIAVTSRIISYFKNEFATNSKEKKQKQYTTSTRPSIPLTE
ncbi:YitT family protein [Halalkalibacter urbisdiaboli]|uniref:YitT family protein n=1 Tax=Halalkalibacter urbisdiaboli TaxID=1960589 RepID=UPI000B42FA02|nr:YitT family protein [Halalkalibacter urbisdiaboli]